MRTSKMPHSQGYTLIYMPEHPRSNIEGYVLEHIPIAEKVLGRSLKGTEEVHHVDGNGFNNAHNNLVICPDRAYHKLLHVRTRALLATGDPNMRRCCHCKKWDKPENMYLRKASGAEHYTCKAKYRREYKIRTGK